MNLKKPTKKLKSSQKDVTKIYSKKRGLQAEDLMKKAIETVQSLRLKRAPISSSIINAIAKGIVIANDKMLLVENGGHLSVSNSWARNILNEMERNGKKMKRHMAATSKIPMAPALLEEEKFTFQRNIITLVKKNTKFLKG